MSSESLTLENGQVANEDLLSIEEEEFVMAVVEEGGNLGAAYRSVFTGSHNGATAKAQAILARPAVARRLAQLRGSIHESQLITIESHLIELANIRDLAKAMGAVKVALDAETTRGKVIGLYVAKGENSDVPKTVSHLQKLAERVEAMLPQNHVQDAVIVHEMSGTVQ